MKTVVVKKLGLRGLLLLLSGIGLTGMVVLSLLFLSAFHSALENSKKNEVRQRVELAESLVKDFYGREQRGELTRSEAQARAKDSLRRLRTADDDYLWINDTDYVMLMHPFSVQLEGKNLADMRDANGKLIVAAFVDTARRDGAGYVSYAWPKPGSQAPLPKLSYVALFAPWQWVIGSGIYVDDIETAFRQQLWLIGTLVGSLGLITIVLGYRLRRLVLQTVGGKMADAFTIANRLASGDLSKPIELAPAADGAEGGAGGLVRLLHFFSDRRRAEIEHRRLSEALKQSHEAIVLAEADLHFAYVNPAFCRLFGYSPAEVIGQSVRLLEVVDSPSANSEATTTIARQSGLFHGEVLRRAKDGREIPVLINIAPLFDEDKIITGYVATMTDLSEIKRVTENLREHQEKFRAIFDQTFQFIGILSPTGELLDCNQTALQSLHLTLADLQGQKFWETLWWVDSPEQQALLKQAVQRAAAGEFVRIEVTISTPDGRRYLDFSLKPVFDSHGQIELLIPEGRDITERKLAEEEARRALAEVNRINSELLVMNRQLEQAQNQVLQSEKMASIGVLAAGVAHEINNPIGFVSSNLSTLENYVGDLLALIAAYEKAEVQAWQCGSAEDNAGLFSDVEALKQDVDLHFLREDVISLLAESHDGIERVTNIVQNLKDFARISSTDDWAPEDLHAGLESTLQVVWNELKYKCEVVKEYGRLPRVECLLSQINQVFMNLLVNAAQAIEGKGVITLRSGVSGEEVWIEVADTGKGIPPEQLKQIFDPFFTTKPVGKGTGLGLSVSYSIIEKHRGRIEVSSEIGKGTTFRLWLPIKQPPEEATA